MSAGDVLLAALATLVAVGALVPLWGRTRSLTHTVTALRERDATLSPSLEQLAAQVDESRSRIDEVQATASDRQASARAWQEKVPVLIADLSARHQRSARHHLLSGGRSEGAAPAIGRFIGG